MADISKRLEKAEKYIQKGKMNDALDEFLAALEEDPGNSTVRERAADLCISQNQGQQAATLLGVLFDDLASIGDQTRAIVTYKKLARVGAPSVEQSFRYAQFVEKSNKKEAMELYQRAAQGFSAVGKKSDALAAYKRLVALEPTLEGLQSEGELAHALGDGKTASGAFFAAGELERKANRDGFQWFERAYKSDTANPEAALAYARSLLERGDGAGALKVAEPLAKASGSPEGALEVYARALMRLKRAEEAAALLLPLYQKDQSHVAEMGLLVGAFLDQQQYGRALEIAHQLEEGETKLGRQREFVTLIKEMMEKHAPDAEFLEYAVEVFNANNREHDYCQALVKLFQLYYAAGNFLKAGDCLDAAAEVDPYEPGHQKRLEVLKPHIDANRYRSIANRFASVMQTAPAPVEAPGAPAPAESEPTVLEDFMLQAEIFLQYSMRSKAAERLERIQKLFPHEEDRNEKLRSLYQSAGVTPRYEPPPAAAARAAPAAAAAAAAAPAPAFAAPAPVAHQPSAVANENAVDNIARVTEITRNIYRQANVKAVLFAAVNDVGRHWNASRCVAGLCTPGKPPSSALEYCAPGIKQSEVMALVKLIGALQAMAVAQGPVAITSVGNAPGLAAVKPFTDALGLESVLAVPLLDGEEHVGVLILEQCGAPRVWRQTDVLVLKTIADQVVLAVNNAKLRNLMKTLAVTDEKSGLLKRASYIDVLLSEVRRGLGQSSQCSVMLLNCGRAAALVKEIGEPAVETMMQQVGQICCSHIRQNDVAVRYDLTSIALVLADTNDKSAFFVVDKLRKVLVTVKVPGSDRTVPCTVGIAEAVMQTRFDPVDIVTEVINRAEAALDMAKHEGGNKAQSLAPALEAVA